MDTLQREIDQGLQVIQEHVAERLPNGVVLTWERDREDDYTLLAVIAGQGERVVGFDHDFVLDVAHSSGGKRPPTKAWNAQREFIDPAVDQWQTARTSPP